MMKRLIPVFLFLFFACTGFAQTGKNILNAEFRTPPGDFETLLRTEPDKWHFGFRPYGDGGDVFATDPIVQRDALSGKETGKNVCALRVMCDPEGFTMLVYSSVQNLENLLAAGKDLPSALSECYFAPGDEETADVEVYYQFLMWATDHNHYRDQPDRKVRSFPWFVEDRQFRNIANYISADFRRTSNGVVEKIFIPWECLFDRLPLTDKKDNIWRMNVICNGLTWGGQVHQMSRAGYVRWPDFTQEQRTALRKNTLLKGWAMFHRDSKMTELDTKRTTHQPLPPWLEKQMSGLYSFKFYAEDPGFRAFWLDQALKERLALGEQIAKFETMSEAEQVKFYKTASGKLYNFRYDVENAYRLYMESKLFCEPENGKE